MVSHGVSHGVSHWFHQTLQQVMGMRSTGTTGRHFWTNEASASEKKREYGAGHQERIQEILEKRISISIFTSISIYISI